MKLRWSDGHSYADTFQANDEQSFVANGIAAMRVFRLATGRMVHRGETHTNEYVGVSPQLHLQIDGRWYGPGHIDSAGENSWQFLKEFQVVFRHNVAPTLDAMHAADAEQIATSAATWWRGVVDAWRWSGAIDAMIMEVGDMLLPGDEE